MSEQSSLQTKSEKLKRALTWLAENLQHRPEQKRQVLLQEAELRFDLTPAECAFLDQHFGAQ